MIRSEYHRRAAGERRLGAGARLPAHAEGSGAMADPGFQAVRAARMSDAVIGQMLKAAVSGALVTGAPLPTEAELIAQFGVSRTVVRDALKVLEEKGVVSVGQGRRTILLDRHHWDILDPDVMTVVLEGQEGPRLFEELITIRLALECAMAEQAARRITDDELLAISACLEAMGQQLDASEDFLESDIAFHELIMSASGHMVARSIMRSIQEPLRITRRVTNRVPNGIPRAHAYHAAIFRRLEQRDPIGAREAMRDHLEWTREAWLTSIAAEAPAEFAEVLEKSVVAAGVRS